MKKINFKIGKRKIGEGQPVFVIAEISANHDQKLAKAEKLVKSACECGVDAVKLQTFTPDTLTIDCSKKWFQVKVNKAWKGRTLYQLYKEAYLPWEWQPKLKKIAESYNIPLFSTSYDETSVDFLEKMKIPAYKVASFEIGDIELLKKVASTGKPVIISRGMASMEEIKLALSTLKKNGSGPIAVLHCVSSYPTNPEEMNLATIPDIKKRFKVVTGLSDHTLTTSIAVASVALGASIVEKHFTLNRADGGLDSAFSLEPEELRFLIKSIREVEKSIGKACYSSGRKESENTVFKKSIFAVQDIKAGDKFTRQNIRSIRPGYGLAPKYFSKIIEKKAKENIERGTPTNWDMIN